MAKVLVNYENMVKLQMVIAEENGNKLDLKTNEHIVQKAFYRGVVDGLKCALDIYKDCQEMEGESQKNSTKTKF